MFEKLDILRMFFESPNREFNVREVARIIKRAPSTVSIELKQIAKEGILKEKKERRFNFYKANLDSDLYRDLKVFYNIRKIKNSGIIEKLNQDYLKPTIILFGSAAHGIDTETSDLDFVIISEKTKPLSAKEFEKKLGKEIQMFIVKDLKELKNKHLINNVLNGIILQGELRWI